MLLLSGNHWWFNYLTMRTLKHHEKYLQTSSQQQLFFGVLILYLFKSRSYGIHKVMRNFYHVITTTKLNWVQDRLTAAVVAYNMRQKRNISPNY